MQSNKQALGSLSLGQHPSHSLDHKIQLTSKYGFTGIEVVFSDLQTYSDKHNISILDGAARIKQLCDANNVEVLALAPFENFEGARSPLSTRLATAKHWLAIARILKAPYVQVPSQFNPDAITDENVIVHELQQLADLGSAETPVVAIAYEYLSWGTYCSTWDTALRLVQLVNRPNFGLCLDTFHELTKLWGSPFETSGKYPSADQDLRDSLQRFKATVPLEKIFYVQLSDGERFDPPFSASHPWYVEGEAPEFTWSKHGRPFPLETSLGGYMPVPEVVKTWVLKTGFQGWISMEVFDRQMRSREFEPETAAIRARESWRKVQAAVGPPMGRL
ncbi:4-hydroxyphenylpyruvate dioxygenase [Aspergillus steynii IBT 23096]|uniref:4-hydroxyphenylpyruvate dioxygenase n=1 Tax=Aspergillus steynii IBT 23096 TaxID=1392250 RepID=A0A2I2FWK7_9EURO|nr:4-hydroxyphenylpyruvate dioxygenase [Aspergillus steynii IBT 23096]PLB45004.1 4-hydroxyphenylpyruvate dioxygenase [Aspergillus steynii IBT 23096]